METNAADHELANRLVGINTDNIGVGQGTMVSIVLKKKGTVAGKITYGDDVVHVLVWTGFKYSALVERSRKKLQQMLDSGTIYGDLLNEALNNGVNATMDDVAMAVHEINASLLKTTQSNNGVVYDNEHAWQPLKVNDVEIIGVKVYVGLSDTIDKGTLT